MGLCLFIKPFRSLKGKLQIKGDLKRHSFASLVRSSFISGASVDRRSLYFLDNESSPRFTTTNLHYKHDDKVMAYRTNMEEPADVTLPDLENDTIKSEEENELETLSQKAVNDALLTVTEEYLEDFAHTFVSNILKNLQSDHNNSDIILKRQEQSTLQEPDNEEPKPDRQVQSETVPLQDTNLPQFSPIDYTTLCVPKDYRIFGNKVEKMAKEDREAVLSKRGLWPSDEAIEYQFEFVEMMKGIEAENERAEGEVDDNIAVQSRLRECDADYSEESINETSDDDDDENLTITFEVGPSEINRYPDQARHYEINEIMGRLSDGMLEEEEKPSTSHSEHWNEVPPHLSPPVSVPPPPHRRCPPPPPPPYHRIYPNHHPATLHPMMRASREAHHLDSHQVMMMMMRGAKEREGVRGHSSRTEYPHQWHDRRFYPNPAPFPNRVPPYPGRPNFRNGQRFIGRCDWKQQTPSEPGRYEQQPRSRPTPFPYNPSRQPANYDRVPPPQCRQRARWDKPTHQSYPFRQEWGGSSHQFGSSYQGEGSYHSRHPHHHHHHHRHVDRNDFNRRQR